MPAPDIHPLRDLEDAQQSYIRVQYIIDAQDPNDLSAHNVDLSAAASIGLGVAAGILAYREKAKGLPDFDIKNMDNLVDYLKTVWFLHITNFPVLAPPRELEQEVGPLRAKLMMWALPLASTGIFSQVAIDTIRDGAGIKNYASDLVALAVLYRSVWDQVRDMCGVTEEDIERAAKIGPAVFAAASRRDNEPAVTPESTLRVRKAWTVLDRAYHECRRAISYFRFDEGDLDIIAPSLRTNAGPRPQTAKPAQPVAPVPEAPAPAEPAIGDGGRPFLTS